MSEDTDSGGNVRIDESVPVAVTEDVPTPSPDRSPEDVLVTVLSALRTNDQPRADAGVATAFAFASPAYRTELGGYEGLRERLTGPVYGALLDHDHAKRGRLRREGRRAAEKVVVIDGDGEATTYRFSLVCPEDGEYADYWLLSEVELTYVGDSPDHRHVPLVEFEGVEVKCEAGEVLREVLLRATGVAPDDREAEYANCNGKGLCGTCAVEVRDGGVSETTAREKRRLRLPPHDDADDPALRLACQCRVLDDVRVHRHEDFWERHTEEYDLQDRPEKSVEDEDSDVGDDGSDGDSDDDTSLSLDEETRSLLEETEDVIGDE